MGVVQAGPHVSAHHGLAAHEVLLLLETGPGSGLAEDEALRWREHFGSDVLPSARRRGPLARLLSQLHHPLISVLLAAGAITLALGEQVDAVVIFGVVAVSTLVGYVQESRAEAALDALRAMVHTEVRVVRGGRARRLASEELVPGDLALVGAGDPRRAHTTAARPGANAKRRGGAGPARATENADER